LVVIAALAVAVSVLGAGPALAAKGGNNDTAHACQHGGHERLFDAAAGNPFKNAGDCVNNGAKGLPVFGANGTAACDAINGSFSLDTDPTHWDCGYDPSAHPDGAGALNGACNADTGNSGTFSISPPIGDHANGTCATTHSVVFGAFGEAACAAIRGDFSRPSLGVWRCEYTPATDREPPKDASTLGLSAACDQDTQAGAFFPRPNSISDRPPWSADCFASPPSPPSSQEILVADADDGTGLVIGVDPATGARTTVAVFPFVDAQPVGVAREANGEILVTDLAAFGGQGGLIRVDPATRAVTTVSANGAPAGGPDFAGPVGVAVEADGDILVADQGAGGPAGVIRVDPATGARTLVSANGAPRGGPNFADPSGVAVEADGDILVADENAFGGTGGVIRVDPSSGARTTVSANGAPAGGPAFSAPFGLALEGDGDILVADFAAGSDHRGAVIRVDPATGARTLVSANGAPPGDPEFAVPFGVAVEADGHIVVVNNGLPSGGPGGVIRVDPATGERTNVSANGAPFGPPGTPDFGDPRALAVVPRP
jgi:sugar lactone lactonase YvrE